MGSVNVDVTGSVATVTLFNPPRFNAMSRAMWRELKAVFEELAAKPDLRCVVVTGAGEHFSAGGDISEYTAFRFNETSLREFHEGTVWGALQAMLGCNLPIVASIQGNCMGSGLEIASCCDIRLASSSARFGAPIAKLGFPMAPREAALVVSAVGDLTARDMLLTAAVLEAPTLQQRGFLNQVCSAENLNLEVQSRVNRICQLAPNAAAMNKQSFRAFDQAIRAQAASELIANAYRYADTAEHREGITAFMEKRSPQF